MKLSVIMPVYNSEKTINDAILSFNKSKFKEKELIIIDDGSTDNSIEIINNFIKSQKNITLILSEHKGPGHARNIGIENSRGQYITFLDSDDRVPPYAYSYLYDYAEKNKADIIIGQLLRKINQSKWYSFLPLKNLHNRYKDKNICGLYEVIIMNPSLWNKILKKSIIDKYKIKFSQEYMMEDLLFLIEYFLKIKKGFIIDEIVYTYESNIVRKESLILSNDYKILLSGFRILNQLIKIFPPHTNFYENKLILENNFKFLMDRFLKTQPNEILFNALKKYLKNFKNIEEYELIIKKLYKISIQDIIDIKLNIFILLNSEK